MLHHMNTEKRPKIKSACVWGVWQSGMSQQKKCERGYKMLQKEREAL